MSDIHCRWMCIPEMDVGDFGHVDNHTYIMWMRDMAQSHFSEMGIGRAFLKELGQCFVVRRQRVEHISPCFLGDKVLFATAVSELGNKALKRQHRVFKLDESENLRPVLRATALGIFVDQSVKPTSIPEDISDVINVVSDREFSEFIRSVELPPKLSQVS